jgi:hypothetical protein
MPNWQTEEKPILRGDELLRPLRQNSAHPGIITGWQCEEHGLVTPHMSRVRAANGEEYKVCDFCFQESMEISMPTGARLKSLEEVIRERIVEGVGH